MDFKTLYRMLSEAEARERNAGKKDQAKERAKRKKKRKIANESRKRNRK